MKNIVQNHHWCCHILVDIVSLIFTIKQWKCLMWDVKWSSSVSHTTFFVALWRVSVGIFTPSSLKILRGASQELTLIRVNTLRAIKGSQMKACMSPASSWVFAASGGSVWFVRGHQMKHLASICVLGVCGLPASRPPSVTLEGFSRSSRRQTDIWHPDTS